MKRERQTKIFISTMIIIFVLMTFLIPLGSQTKKIFQSLSKVNIPIGMSIDDELNDLSNQVQDIINREYTVIYQDGENDKVFKKEVYNNCDINNIPKFKGKNTKKDYKFIGWYIDINEDTIIYTASYEKSS